jgi:hypothetical protein
MTRIISLTTFLVLAFPSLLLSSPLFLSSPLPLPFSLLSPSLPLAQVAPDVWVTNVVFEEEGDTGGGNTYQFERIGRRDQLFIRLISLAGQQWETL